ncbi:MAG: hypothetical protein INR73_17995 [Williamsia sp.]|nr:hypothetical protein [Williamsia sp.]
MHPVLEEDWKDYDQRKARNGRNVTKVACEEAWETNYIVDKLQKHFPDKSDLAIRCAIRRCCEAMEAPRPREDFIECIIDKLASWP